MLLQDIEYCSLCCTVISCCSYILYIVCVSVNPILLMYIPVSPLETISFFPMSANLFLFYKQIHSYYFLDSTDKWYQTIFVFLCLTYLTYYDSLQTHPCFWKAIFYSFLWLSNIPLHVCIHTHTHTHTYIYTKSSWMEKYGGKIILDFKKLIFIATGFNYFCDVGGQWLWISNYMESSALKKRIGRGGLSVKLQHKWLLYQNLNIINFLYFAMNPLQMECMPNILN